MSEALITPDVLKWARNRCGFTHDELAKKLKIKPEKLKSWEIKTDTAKPTMRQVKEIARRTYIPFGYLLLDKPPREEFPFTDFRMGRDKKVKKDDVHLYDFVHSIIYKKDWYEAYLADQQINYNSDEYQGKFTLNDDPIKIAQSIQNWLGLDDVSHNQPRGKPDRFWPNFVSAAEKAGLWIMRTGTVGTSTSRIIPEKLCRGLAIKGQYNPVIWVNSRLSKAARIFTLAHELSHIWIGEEGYSNFDAEAEAILDNSKEIADIERFCDQVAAELLVPRDCFDSLWKQDGDTISLIDELFPIFGVSHFVLLNRAREAKKISLGDYKRTKQELNRRVHPVNNAKGGNANRTLLARNGRKFTIAVLSELMEDNISYRVAKKLLDVANHNRLHTIYEDIIEGKL